MIYRTDRDTGPEEEDGLKARISQLGLITVYWTETVWFNLSTPSRGADGGGVGPPLRGGFEGCEHYDSCKKPLYLIYSAIHTQKSVSSEIFTMITKLGAIS